MPPNDKLRDFQNARFTSGFNESGMGVEHRPLPFQNF
jgi:hypothetical protein